MQMYEESDEDRRTLRDTMPANQSSQARTSSKFTKVERKDDHKYN